MVHGAGWRVAEWQVVWFSEDTGPPSERLPGCSSSDGGGGGGGGGGGSSIGVLVVGSKPKRTGGTVTLGTPGSGGNGGMGVTRAAKGDEGAAVEQLNL